MKKVFLIVGIVLFASCSGNGIYFDLQNHMVISCGNKYIEKIYIENMDHSDFYIISVKKGKEKGKAIDIINVSNSYEIKNNLDKLIKVSNYKLKPSSKYQITNASWGDAAEQSIIITLDANGIINDASVLSCN